MLNVVDVKDTIYTGTFMNDIATFQARFQELDTEWLAHFEKIMADERIDYPESMDTRGFLAMHETKLNALNAEVIANLEAMRESYRQKGAEASTRLDGKALNAEIHRLRTEYQGKLQPYRELTSKIKLLQLEIPPNREHIEKLIANYENEMDRVITDFNNVVYDDYWGVDKYEKHLLQQLDHWEQLLKAVNARLHAPTTPPAQKAYDSGVQAALQMVIKDIQSLLER